MIKFSGILGYSNSRNASCARNYIFSYLILSLGLYI